MRKKMAYLLIFCFAFLPVQVSAFEIFGVKIFTKAELDSDNDGQVDIAAGGTNAGTAADARTNLGVVNDQIVTLTGDANIQITGTYPNFAFSFGTSGLDFMVYPGAGIPISTGSAWGTSLTDNHTQWDSAYGWGNHASVGYLTSESDPGVSTHESTYNHGNYNTAYSHATTTTGNPHSLDYADIGLSANQVLDWTSDQGATNIHAGNYTDNDTTYTAGTGMSLVGTTFNCTITQFSPGTLFGDYGFGTSNINTSGVITSISDGAILSDITRDSEWDTTTEINAATTDKDFSTTDHDHAGVYEPSFGTGATTKFFRGDKTYTQVPYSSLSGTPSTFAPTSHGNEAHLSSFITSSDMSTYCETTQDYLKTSENNDTLDSVSSSDVQSALSNDFHNAGGTDDDVPDNNDIDIDYVSGDSVDDDKLDAGVMAEADPLAVKKADYTAANDILVGSGVGTYTAVDSSGWDKDSSNDATAGGAFHDGFSDYVANEHIDWTADQGATNIHAGNYTDTDTDDQAATEVAVTTTGFAGIFANDATSDTVQECLDLADDHPHTTTTISGLDISSDTNLTAGEGLTLTDDTLDFTWPDSGVPVYANGTAWGNSIPINTNNTMFGVNGFGTVGAYSNFMMGDDAAQFYQTENDYTLKLDLVNLTANKTLTLANSSGSLYPFGSVTDTKYCTYDSASGQIKCTSEGGGTSSGSQYDVQIADAASGFDSVTGEFKYQNHTLYVGTGGINQAKDSGVPGQMTLYSSNSSDTYGGGFKGYTGTNTYNWYLAFPSDEPASANSIWAHGAASSHNSAGSWLVVGTGANNLVQLDGSAKLPAVDGSQLTNLPASTDSETIYDSDGGNISVTKNNTIVIAGAACSVTPMTPGEGVNLMVQNAPGTTGAITIVNLTDVYYGKSDASGYITVNHKYVSGGANTDRIVLIGIDSTHYICATATGTWTDTAP